MILRDVHPSGLDISITPDANFRHAVFRVGSGSKRNHFLFFKYVSLTVCFSRSIVELPVDFSWRVFVVVLFWTRKQELLKVWLNKDDEYDSTSQSGVSQFVILSDDMMNSPIHSSHMTLHTAPLRRMSRPNAACQSQRSFCRRSVPRCCK
ncbi:hypothetical protein QQF64_015040 [Cirrhinus molitorella]|uniref:Uncharacterized protein n=1 Tax=Cirrhinus molitorella TaxID=172907 RepID=A0ABR3NTU1_9TELE